MAKRNMLYKEFDALPWIVKLILALPVLDAVWGVYRIIKGIEKKDLALTIIGIVWVFAGIFLLWLVDLVALIVKKDLILA